MHLILLGVLLSVGFFILLGKGIEKFPSKKRIPIYTTVFTLVFTPSLAPATIVAIPLPFGIIILIGFLAGAPHEIPSLVSTFWQWHAVSFSMTAIVGFLLAKRRFNKSVAHESLT